MLLGRHSGVELQADPVGPPSTLSVRAGASEIQIGEEPREDWIVHERFEAHPV